jgi:hypothetical protein
MFNVEDNINFYEELKKQLEESKNEIVINQIIINNESESESESKDDIIFDNDQYIGKCLITNEKLTKGYVTLLCNHSFNYIPLYNDLLHHKKTLYLDTQMLKTNEIRCPYCRNKQSVLLPYYECMGVQKINGINFFKKVGTFVGECQYSELKTAILLSDCHDMKSKLLNESSNEMCSNIVSILTEDEKCYCSFHKKKAKSIYYKRKKYEEKMKLKQKKQEEKLKKKEETQTQSQNVLIDMNLCNIILVSGKNKGLQCTQKTYVNHICKRHYNLQIKNEIIQIIEE